MERRKPTKARVKIIRDEDPVCPVCGSEVVVNAGLRMATTLPTPGEAVSLVQRYRCKSCGSSFRAGRKDKGFRRQFSNAVIVYARERVGAGDSGRRTSLAIKAKFGVRVSSTTVWHWSQDLVTSKKDMGAGWKVSKAFLLATVEEQNATALSEITGVKYNTVKTILRRKKIAEPRLSKHYGKERLVRSRITFLKNRIADLQEELARIEKA